jgi:hypothetical protein
MNEQDQWEEAEYYKESILQNNIENNDDNELTHIYYQQNTESREQLLLIQNLFQSQSVEQVDTNRNVANKQATNFYEEGVNAQEEQKWDIAENFYEKSINIYKKYLLDEEQIKVYNKLEELYLAKNEYEKFFNATLESMELSLELAYLSLFEQKLERLKDLYQRKDVFNIVMKQRVAKFIINNYGEIGEKGNTMLEILAEDENKQVGYTIIQTISIKSKSSYEFLRMLQAKLISVNITVQIIKGGGMVIDQENNLIIRVTNYMPLSLDMLEIELCPSAEYILAAHKHVIPILVPDSSHDLCFRMTLKVAKQVAVNYRINNGELEKPALYVNGIKDNPYIYGDPVNEPIAFFGREDELNQILQAMTKPAKQDILIVGERRTGKTSLLYQLQQRLKWPFIPVYINLSPCRADTDSILNHILEHIVRNLIEQHILDENWNRYQPAYSDFTARIYEILQIARNKLADITLILLLDEADFLLAIEEKNGVTPLAKLLGKYMVDERVQRILRAALQSSQISSCLRATVAGTTDLSRYVSRRASPFFNHFRSVQLKPLTILETENLITEPASLLGLSYSREAIRRISHLSGGLPYYCQALCYEAFSYASQQKSTTIGDQAISVAEKKIKTDFFYAYQVDFWQRATFQERKLLVALAQGKPLNNVRKTQIKRLLLDWQVLIKEHDIYRFTAGLFKDWTLMAAGKEVDDG